MSPVDCIIVKILYHERAPLSMLKSRSDVALRRSDVLRYAVARPGNVIRIALVIKVRARCVCEEAVRNYEGSRFVFYRHSVSETHKLIVMESAISYYIVVSSDKATDLSGIRKAAVDNVTLAVYFKANRVNQHFG